MSECVVGQLCVVIVMLYRPKSRFDAWWSSRSVPSTSSLLKVSLSIVFSLFVAFFLYVIAQNMTYTHGSQVFKLDIADMNAQQKQQVIDAAKKINSNLIDLARKKIVQAEQCIKIVQSHLVPLSHPSFP